MSVHIQHSTPDMVQYIPPICKGCSVHFTVVTEEQKARGTSMKRVPPAPGWQGRNHLVEEWVEDSVQRRYESV